MYYIKEEDQTWNSRELNMRWGEGGRWHSRWLDVALLSFMTNWSKEKSLIFHLLFWLSDGKLNFQELLVELSKHRFCMTLYTEYPIRRNLGHHSTNGRGFYLPSSQWEVIILSIHPMREVPVLHPADEKGCCPFYSQWERLISSTQPMIEAQSFFSKGGKVLVLHLAIERCYQRSSLH